MSDAAPIAPPPPRTPEQLALVRRRSLPVAAAGAFFGVLGIALLLMTLIAVGHPPNILAANLSFCAIMMGVGILFYARGAPGTTPARWLCVAAILTGLAGPAIFAWQSTQWHRLMEDREAENAAAIAQAAAKYATDHAGKYPEDFLELVRAKYLDANRLLSPFGGIGSEYIGSLKTPLTPEARPQAIAEHADYTYTGSDLHQPLGDGASKIIVVYETDPVMGEHYAVGFADGTAQFFVLADAQQAMDASNQARKKLQLPPLDDPDSLKRARDAENGK